MADVSTPLGASPANRKVVLLGLGSKSSLDVNKSLFDWANVNIVDEEDDVYVMHFTRKKKTGMSAIKDGLDAARGGHRRRHRRGRREGGRLGSAESPAGVVP
jgi:hypothetical protein